MPANEIQNNSVSSNNPTSSNLQRSAKRQRTGLGNYLRSQANRLLNQLGFHRNPFNSLGSQSASRNSHFPLGQLNLDLIREKVAPALNSVERGNLRQASKAMLRTVPLSDHLGLSVKQADSKRDKASDILQRARLVAVTPENPTSNRQKVQLGKLFTKFGLRGGTGCGKRGHHSFSK
jgi:hypothetical protein